MPYAKWLQANAPTYFQDPYGQAWMGGIGAAMDDYVQQYIAGTLASFPDFAPTDALGFIGDELGLDQGPSESNASYATRLVGAWTAWPLAGTPVGILAGLYWAGFTGAVLIQQNGQAYSLSGALTPGVDPRSSLVITQCSQLAVALTSSVTPPTAASAGRSIPAATPWWTLDSNTDFCSRFAILFPSPAGGFFFSNVGRATFTASDSAVATWGVAMPVSNYPVNVGPPVVTDGGGPVVLTADGTTVTTTGITIRASAPFTGYADCTAIGGLSANDLQRLQNAIRKWRPAKATCVGVYVVASGKCFAWPVQPQSSNTMGAASIVQIVAPF